MRFVYSSLVLQKNFRPHFAGLLQAYEQPNPLRGATCTSREVCQAQKLEDWVERFWLPNASAN
jgi:hypothetical protein